MDIAPKESHLHLQYIHTTVYSIYIQNLPTSTRSIFLAVWFLSALWRPRPTVRRVVVKRKADSWSWGEHVSHVANEGYLGIFQFCEWTSRIFWSHLRQISRCVAVLHQFFQTIDPRVDTLHDLTSNLLDRNDHQWFESFKKRGLWTLGPTSCGSIWASQVSNATYERHKVDESMSMECFGWGSFLETRDLWEKTREASNDLGRLKLGWVSRSRWSIWA